MQLIKVIKLVATYISNKTLGIFTVEQFYCISADNLCLVKIAAVEPFNFIYDCNLSSIS